MIEIRHVEDANLTEAYDAYYTRQTTAHDRDYYRWLVKLLRSPGRAAGCWTWRAARARCCMRPRNGALSACGVDLSQAGFDPIGRASGGCGVRARFG